MKTGAFFLFAAALAVLASGPSWAQNGMSFSRADRSVSGFSKPVAGPTLACKNLRRLAGYGFSVSRARPVPAANGVPAHCRVDGTILPQIGFRVNLPAAWNGRFYMHGNGGFAGTPADGPGRLRVANSALAQGFATAYTDTGHSNKVYPLGGFAYNDRQAEIDYAFRAVHVTAETAKRLIERYYGRAAERSYFDGCSTGGRQGLMSAQRFPADFDGIAVGAPVLNFSGTVVAYAKFMRGLRAAPIDRDRIALVADAVMARCDKLDGLEDGLLDDPRNCDFDPARDLPRCTGKAAKDCFSDGQIAALKGVYEPVMSKGEVYFPGLPVGAEVSGPWFGGTASGWVPWLIPGGVELIPGNAGTVSEAFGNTFLRYLAFDGDDPDYDFAAFDFDKDVDRMGFIEGILNATDPDLSAFRARGGKILMYFGWADAGLNPLMGVGYYEDVVRTLGPGTDDFFRLFMVPGMFHCFGGPGPSTLDAMTPLIDWVEQDAPPERLEAAHVDGGKVAYSRPLCPYPQVARYKGSGGTTEATNFTCRAAE